MTTSLLLNTKSIKLWVEANSTHETTEQKVYQRPTPTRDAQTHQETEGGYVCIGKDYPFDGLFFSSNRRQGSPIIRPGLYIHAPHWGAIVLCVRI